ncbi:MAG: phospholipase D-like domain-containing protein [Thermoplasmatales archaeon]|nr:phospholipase D-like domain-containing protein [Thermoplasmatales archaeon]
MKKKILMSFVLGILLFSMIPNMNCEMHENRMPSDLNSVLIVEVYYDTYLKDEPEEYVRIYNPTSEDVDIGNWSISDSEGDAVFPEGTILSSNNSFYVTRNASAFYEEMYFKPDFAYYNNSMDDVPLINGEGNLRLANTGDDVILKDNQNNVVDVVVYGDLDYDGVGWNSNPAKGVGEGTVLRRNTDEETGAYLDTNTSSDWDSLRMYKIGQSDFPYETFSFNGNVTCFVSPDSSYGTIVNEIDNAKESIYISVYQLTSMDIAEHLVSASKRNVAIKVLLEGMPAFWNMTNVNGTYYEQNPYPYREAYAEKYIAKILYENGTEVRFMINDDKQDIHDRYRYVHNKFIVVDNSSVIISSENLKQTGIPTDNSYGNRGWGVVVRNKNVSKYFSDVFFDDWNPEMKDSFPFTPNHSKYGNPPDWFKFDEAIYTGNYEPVFSGITINGLFNVSPVLSPDTSLLETESVIGMINSAKTSVYIEQASCNIDWVDRRTKDKKLFFNWSDEKSYYLNWNDSNTYHNLYLNAAIDAAKRGCDVKILLDARYVDSDDNTTDNLDTVAYINQVAEEKNLTLQAKLVYIKNLSKIHNKGVIVDGNKTLISSINWGRSAVIENREAGVIIKNRDVAEYFTSAFFYDWNTGNETENEDISTDEKAGQNLSSWWIVFLVIIIILIVSVVRDIYRRRR